MSSKEELVYRCPRGQLRARKLLEHRDPRWLVGSQTQELAATKGDTCPAPADHLLQWPATVHQKSPPQAEKGGLHPRAFPPLTSSSHGEGVLGMQSVGF